ncbi:glutamine--fructose-6-phosphate transaminase (isomerizing) [Rhizobium sp. EC-SD404]|uniref:glutamine--fructose-6-phosphate transaminase (isomerizing) n=1 Tax=Rhizobium sp. EC-SD404 TaxID=2038389 RepID=UPI00125C43CD|nr:glutamine--fructose-6-phosphate transaminase (isomerizing) [Rhizobium sp. EC-SD404]VVT15391.1 L-glutamine:D-fructose-6-phosphate aminotransferase [Rhizobium sp. EC-SD404]
MCGIIGIIGTESVAPRMVDALKRLEYRGYDSAGVATLEDGKLDRRRAEGKLVNLEKVLAGNPLGGTIGIGHTRWATHGAPTENNAHPHFVNGVAVVHNGIIENFAVLRNELRAKGITFRSETDTETVAALISTLIAEGADSVSAMREAVKRFEGAYAIAVMIEGEGGMLLAARHGPPLAIGHGNGEMFLGSDSVALAPFTDRITYLEDGDWAVVTAESATIYDRDGAPVTRSETRSQAMASAVDRGNHRHFMEKEIYEQPEAISRTMSRYIDFAELKSKPIDGAIDFSAIDRLTMSACGTAFYAGMIGKYWFERYARLPVEIDIASEFRYREMPLGPRDAAIFISQSGETADTLASLRYCKDNGLPIGAVVNVQESTIAREANAIFPTLAGIEVGVASTKAFTAQLTVLASLSIIAGRQRGTIDEAREAELCKALVEIPGLMTKALNDIQPQIEKLAQELSHYKHVLYLGRGTSFPLAMEGALKLKEISYIHAEGYAAGELKHGPIALIDETMPVIVIAPYDAVFAKTVSNMQEVAARGGRIILITDAEGAAAADMETMATLIVPKVPEIAAPIVYSAPIQLLAYHTAVFMGTDVDQPRNLAKSVTVE